MQASAESGRLAKLEAGTRLLAALLGVDDADVRKPAAATPQQRASFAKVLQVWLIRNILAPGIFDLTSSARITAELRHVDPPAAPAVHSEVCWQLPAD